MKKIEKVKLIAMLSYIAGWLTIPFSYPNRIWVGMAAGLAISISSRILGIVQEKERQDKDCQDKDCVFKWKDK